MVMGLFRFWFLRIIRPTTRLLSEPLLAVLRRLESACQIIREVLVNNGYHFLISIFQCYSFCFNMIIFRAVGTRRAGGATAPPPLLLKFHQNSFKIEFFT